MAREDFETSEHTLRKMERLENVSQAEVDAAIQRLSIPLTHVEYKDRGEIDLEGDTWGMHFEYDPVKEMNIMDIKDDGEWREITVAEIETPKGTIDLIHFLGSGRKIYLHPELDDQNREFGEARYEDGVLVWGDLSTPHVLAILLHEIGHIIDYNKLEQQWELGLLSKIDSHEYASEAAELRGERVASAFALKVMRQFLSTEQRRDMILLIKYYALKSYYKHAKRAIAARKATKAAITQEAHRNYEADMVWLDQENTWQDFEDWKQSQEYQEWKTQNPNVPEDDEFSQWTQERQAKE